MNKKKSRISQDTATHLNIGIPFIVTLILAYVNIFSFNNTFIESFFYFFYFYFVSTLFFVFLTYLFAKRKATDKVYVKLNLYIVGVLNSLCVLFFLWLNINYDNKTIYEKYIPIRNYTLEKDKLEIPIKYKKYFDLEPEDFREYGYKVNYFHFKVDESIFGYEILDKREMVYKNN